MLGWELPPHNSGGLGVACLQLCRTLAKKGADISFVVPYDATHTFSFMEVISANIASPSLISGVYDSTHYTSSSTSKATNLYEVEHHYALSMDSLIDGREFSVIHAHDWLTFRAALRVRELTHKPLILHVHSIESDRAGTNGGNPMVKEIEQLGFLMADHIIAVSELTKQNIARDYHIPASKISVAHNSIDFEDMDTLDSDNSYQLLHQLKQSGYKVVVNIGRLTIQKGLPHLLAAAKEVIAREPKTVFLIVGSGEQYRELVGLAASFGISRNVIFTGFQRGKAWRDAFGIADLFVMPSISEPFGLTPLEAAVYGTPSLISRQSGVSEVLKNCLKVDYWDTLSMADAIINAVRHDSLRAELSKNVSRELDRLSWDKAADTVLNRYRHVTEASAA